MENWKDIKGYEGLYQVSDQGNVKGPKGYILKPQSRMHGYLAVFLYKDGCPRYQVSVHRLVAEAFLPKPEEATEVNHIDEDKQNNRASNLEWVTRSENMRRGTVSARIGAAGFNGKKSRPVAQYSLDGDLIATYPSLAEVERRTGFAKANVCRCAQGSKNYSHAYGYIWRYTS